MKQKLISKTNSKNLITFFTGWGCDDNQFKNISTKDNLLILWDYSSLDFDFDFTKYEKKTLITYSAGVFVAGLLQEKLPKFDKKIAINGSPIMFDNYFGIPSTIISTMKNLTEENCEDFIKKFLIFKPNDYENFIKTPALRSFESSLNELLALENYSKQKFTPYVYDIALLSDNDKIFNPIHQHEYFKNKSITLKNSAHNVFDKFKTYEDILKLTELNK